MLDLSGEGGLDGLLSEIYAKRRDIAAFFARIESEGGVEITLRTALGIEADETVEDASKLFWPLHALPVSFLRELEAQATTATTKKFAGALLSAGSAITVAEKQQIVSEAFLTRAGELCSLKNVSSKSAKENFPDIEARLEAAQQQVLAAVDKLNSFAALEANRAALVIARRYISEFERLKQRQAFLDFDDLVAATDNLLSRAGAGAWVHYKLDQA